MKNYTPKSDYIMTNLHLYVNELAQTQKHGTCVADVGVYKAPMHCILRLMEIRNIIGKAADLSDFHMVKSLWLGYWESQYQKPYVWWAVHVRSL